MGDSRVRGILCPISREVRQLRRSHQMCRRPDPAAPNTDSGKSRFRTCPDTGTKTRSEPSPFSHTLYYLDRMTYTLERYIIDFTILTSSLKSGERVRQAPVRNLGDANYERNLIPFSDTFGTVLASRQRTRAQFYNTGDRRQCPVPAKMMHQRGDARSRLRSCQSTRRRKLPG